MRGAYIDDPAMDGLTNMTRDADMARFAAKHGCIMVRTYEWIRPTLSLGRFQQDSELAAQPKLQGLDWVRRGTGGGAILHHFDWTYSVAVPLEGKKGHEAALYESVHRKIIDWFRGFGWNAGLYQDVVGPTGALSCQSSSANGTSCKSFLCFERRSDMDIVVGSAKIVGSAQRRLEGAVLQHGSVLLQASPFAPQLLGLRELPEESTGSQISATRGFTREALGKAVRLSFEQLSSQDWEPWPITKELNAV